MLKKAGIKKGSIALDVGAGSGAFALCLRQSGYFSKIYTCDLSKHCVDCCAALGFQAIQGTIEDMKLSSVDVICVNDVLEHLFNPCVFLSEIRRVLRPRGYVAFATPNGQGFDFQIMRHDTKNITPPEHLQYFNPQSLDGMLRRQGFKTILNSTPGILDVSIVQKEKQHGYPVYRHNRYVDYLLTCPEKTRRDFQEFLSTHNLSSHLFVVAQKKERITK